MGATVGQRDAMTMAVANHATEGEWAPGWRPGPESPLVAVGLSGVALRAGRRLSRLAAALGPGPDRLGRRDGLRLGRSSAAHE